MDDLNRELEAALSTIRAAGAEVMKRYASFEKIENAPADISTDADRASQKLIFERLGAAFPTYGLCGEESAQSVRDAGAKQERLWVIDPIDGTRGFARKNGEFSLMIGLVQAGKVILGAVYEPAIDRITYASHKQGCWFRQPFDGAPKKGIATTTTNLGNAILSMSRSQGAGGEKAFLDAFGARWAVQTYSAGIKLAQVARGETDIYLGDYLTLHDWDCCAGHVLVEEAGGTVTNIFGDPIQYSGLGDSLGGKGIIATNGKLHAATLEILASGKYVIK